MYIFKDEKVSTKNLSKDQNEWIEYIQTKSTTLLDFYVDKNTIDVVLNDNDTGVDISFTDEGEFKWCQLYNVEYPDNISDDFNSLEEFKEFYDVFAKARKEMYVLLREFGIKY